MPGIGLGLNLAKTLIEGMNGLITVESVLGSGTTFIIQLPVCADGNGQLEFPAEAIDQIIR